MAIRIIYLGSNQQFRLARGKIHKEFPTLLANTTDRIRHTLTGGPVFSPYRPMPVSSFSELRDRPAPPRIPAGSRQLVIVEENSFYPVCPGDGLVDHIKERYERRALQQEGAQAAKSRQSRLREPNVMATVASLISVGIVAVITLMIVLVVVSAEVAERDNQTPETPSSSVRGYSSRG